MTGITNHVRRNAHETHRQSYRRIEGVAEIGGKLRVLDMTRPEVRQAVKEAASARALYEGALAGNYG